MGDTYKTASQEALLGEEELCLWNPVVLLRYYSLLCVWGGGESCCKGQWRAQIAGGWGGAWAVGAKDAKQPLLTVCHWDTRSQVCSCRYQAARRHLKEVSDFYEQNPSNFAQIPGCQGQSHRVSPRSII